MITLTWLATDGGYQLGVQLRSSTGASPYSCSFAPSQYGCFKVIGLLIQGHRSVEVNKVEVAFPFLA